MVPVFDITEAIKEENEESDLSLDVKGLDQYSKKDRFRASQFDIDVENDKPMENGVDFDEKYLEIVKKRDKKKAKKMHKKSKKILKNTKNQGYSRVHHGNVSQ